jgi:hypothetical protein
VTLKWWDAVLALLAMLLVLAAWTAGLAMNIVNLFLMAYMPVALGTRFWAGVKKQLASGFVRRPFAREHRPHLVQAVVRCVFVVVWALVLRMSVVPLQLGEAAGALWPMLGFVLTVTAVAAFLPLRRVLAARVVFLVVLTIFFGVQVVMAMTPSSADAVKMPSPLDADVIVIQGGASPLVNHHFLLRAQRNALDLDVVKNGKLINGPPTELKSYACFGAPIHAPFAGTVAIAVNDRPDMAIGKMDREQIVGNHVVLRIGEERFVLFAHLKQGSVVVHEGDEVAAGQLLAQCGNSGNTSSPHLHLQVQNRAELSASDLRTFPMVFGASERPPRRNDRISPR